MAIIKILPSKGRIKNITNYVLNKEKTDDRIISGKDCSTQNVVDEMIDRFGSKDFPINLAFDDGDRQGFIEHTREFMEQRRIRLYVDSDYPGICSDTTFSDHKQNSCWWFLPWL